MRCLIVLPCFNEEENLKKLIFDIDETLSALIPYKIIAVNDGSIDRTFEVLKDLSTTYPIALFEHSQNKGLAETLKTGLKAAIGLSSDADLIVTMDSDNTHDPRYLVKMIETAKEIDVAIGSRYIENGAQLNVPFHRVFLSRIINFLIRIILRIPVNDATSGYRCFRTTTLKRLYRTFGEKFIESKGFEASLEILLKIFLCNFSIKEVPIVLDYGKKNGSSKMRLLSTCRSYLTLFRKVGKWRRIIGT